MDSKKGKIPSELVKIIIMILILVTMAVVIIILFKGGGGRILDSIKNVFRFGR
jgi:hypothetical protein